MHACMEDPPRGCRSRPGPLGVCVQGRRDELWVLLRARSGSEEVCGGRGGQGREGEGRCVDEGDLEKGFVVPRGGLA